MASTQPGRASRTVLVVAAAIAMTVVGVGVVFLLSTSGIHTSPPSIPIAVDFDASNPQLDQCPTGSSYSTAGCHSGDYVYELLIRTSEVSFDSVLFRVINSSGSTVSLSSFGAFAIVNETGSGLSWTNPGRDLVMNESWNSYAAGVSGSTPLTNHYSILVDMGVVDPSGSHFEFVAYGVAPFVGSTYPITLP
jgi:hypothetical protein